MADRHTEETEDIFQEGLALLGEQVISDDSILRYGHLTFTTAPKEGKANTLLADKLFSPALLLAERIERGLLPIHGRTIIELGAGCGLPSLLAATRSDREGAPSLVVMTDYPDALILNTLNGNVARNTDLFAPGCSPRCEGYIWGQNTDHLTQLLPPDRTGFDVVILSDLLHFHDAHDDLVSSTCALLARNQYARVYVAAGRYTTPEVCTAFLSLAHRAGLFLDEVELETTWEGEMDVGGLDRSALGERKRMCRMWEGRWATPV